MSTQTSNDLVLIGNIPFLCESQPRRVSCLLVDSSKIQKILAKDARNKHTERGLFLVSLHFAEEMGSIKTDFGPELDTQLKELGKKFADVTQEPRGLPPHKGIFDTKFVLPLILSVNDVTVFQSLNMNNLRGNALISSKKGWSVSLIVHMPHQSLWFGNLVVLFGYVLSIMRHRMSALKKTIFRYHVLMTCLISYVVPSV